MTIGNATNPAAVSRIGQRRQIVIPKRVYDALKLRAGDFVEVTVERGHLQMRPKRLVDIGDVVLSPAEAAKVRRGEAELKAGQSQSWRAVKDELGS
jgi:AbrB family looped-hinge helix DNA binding protein